ncbi:MAG TPA: hypothetical protein VFE53_18825 [Mucilaginibacter sp.]|jgi:hypothetical protein|nr:hypothetical protein [Mucilaginibacter sp.]
MNQPLELRKARDFGQIISDSFQFLRENFKPLFTSLLVICGIFILVGTVTSTFQYMGMMGIYGDAFSGNSGNAYEVTTYSYTYWLSVLFNAFILLMLELCTYLATMSYISVYLERGGAKPTLAEVWGYFRYYFFRILGSGFVLLLLIMLGMVCCLIPGIYLSVVFSLVIPIIVMENASFSYAFNKSFRLIKENWWFVFGMSIVTGLIVSVLSSVAGVPITVITLMGGFFAHKSYTLPLIVLFSFLRNLLMLTYTLPNTAIALCYFKLSEEKEGLGLLGRMENFGKTTDDNAGLPSEEY